jgi:hypothetical protein
MTSSFSMSDLAILQYDNILTFHGQELQHDTSLKLAHLAQADAAGNRDMAVLADLTYKDSRSMRIATAIAMFYLPVNLVMVRILSFLKFLYLIDPLGTRGCKICYPVQDLLCRPTNFGVTNISHFSVLRLSGMERQLMRQTVQRCKCAARYGSRPWRLLCLPAVLRAGLGGGTGRKRRSQTRRLFKRLLNHNQILQIIEGVPGFLMMDELVHAKSEVLQEVRFEYYFEMIKSPSRLRGFTIKVILHHDCPYVTVGIRKGTWCPTELRVNSNYTVGKVLSILLKSIHLRLLGNSFGLL